MFLRKPLLNKMMNKNDWRTEHSCNYSNLYIIKNEKNKKKRKEVKKIKKISYESSQKKIGFQFL